MIHHRRAALALMFGLLISGCASVGHFDRSEVSLAAPPATAVDAAAPAVVIRAVTDARVFDQDSRDPSVPSLGVDGGGADIQARAIGRKRDGFGRAHNRGDVLLTPGETVEGVVRRHVISAFNQGGVRVIEESAAAPETPRIDVRIDRFWAWLHPSMMIRQNTLVETSLTVAGGGAPVVVSGRSDHEGPIPPDRLWISKWDEALTAWRDQLAHHAPAMAAPTPEASEAH